MSSELDTPTPISPHIPLASPSRSDFLKHHGGCSLVWAFSVPPYILPPSVQTMFLVFLDFIIWLQEVNFISLSPLAWTIPQKVNENT